LHDSPSSGRSCKLVHALTGKGSQDPRTEVDLANMCTSWRECSCKVAGVRGCSCKIAADAWMFVQDRGGWVAVCDRWRVSWIEKWLGGRSVERLGEPLAGDVEVDAALGQDHRRQALSLAEDAQRDVFRCDEVVLETERLAQ
jgi:hypothetical protein